MVHRSPVSTHDLMCTAGTKTSLAQCNLNCFSLIFNGRWNGRVRAQPGQMLYTRTACTQMLYVHT